MQRKIKEKAVRILIDSLADLIAQLENYGQATSKTINELFEIFKDLSDKRPDTCEEIKVPEGTKSIMNHLANIEAQHNLLIDNYINKLVQERYLEMISISKKNLN